MHQTIIVIKVMNKLKKIKLATIIAFLVIVIPGKISLLNFMVMPLILLNFILMLGVEPLTPSLLIEPAISIITILSVFYTFSNKKHFVLLSVLIQYLYLIFIFKIKYLDYWYFTVPTVAYLILSLVSIYFLFFKSNYSRSLDGKNI